MQREAVETFMNRANGVALAEFVEVESGKRADRPKLREALAVCRREQATLRAGETYRVIAVMEFGCPCGRPDSLLDVGVDFAWCQTRFRLLPKPKAQTRTRRVAAPREKETVR